MKRIVSIITALMLTVMLSAVCFAEFKASFSITGPGSIRAGNTLTVQFKADGNGICGILADITYDTSILTYKSSSGELSDWRIEITEKNGSLQIWAEENNGFKSPIKSQKSVVSLNFKVSDKASAGDKINIRANISQVSDTENELSGLSASYSVTVARPLSTDSSLKSLSVDGYTLKPGFSPETTEYEIEGEAEYTQNALKINAKANDEEASVDISGSRLSVGDNTIRIKVTAENDSSTTTYTIKVKMKQDPDYVPSSNAALSKLTLSEGRLSPAFSPDRFDYAVYVPYEAESFSVSGTASDSKADVEAEGPEMLSVGENLFVIKCTSEDGTVNEYKIKVMRMEEYAVGTDTETDTDTDTETEPLTDTETDTDTETEPATDTETVTGSSQTDEPDTTDAESVPETDNDGISALNRNVPLWVVLVAAVGCLAIGALGSVFVFNSLKERK